MEGKLIQARYVPRSPACPPCEHTPHVSRPGRRGVGRVLAGLRLVMSALVVALAIYAGLLAVLLAGGPA